MKGGKFIAFLAGVAAGATALFLSKEENREMAKKEIAKVAEDPKGAIESGVETVVKESKKLASKTSDSVEKAVKSVPKKIEEVIKSTDN